MVLKLGDLQKGIIGDLGMSCGSSGTSIWHSGMSLGCYMYWLAARLAGMGGPGLSWEAKG